MASCAASSGLAKIQRANRSKLDASLQAVPARAAAVAIGALFQNAGNDLEKTYLLMQATVAHFSRHTILMLENDSRDCTAERMRRLCAEFGGHVSAPMPSLLHQPCACMLLDGQA